MRGIFMTFRAGALLAAAAGDTVFVGLDGCDVLPDAGTAEAGFCCGDILCLGDGLAGAAMRDAARGDALPPLLPAAAAA